MWIIINCGKFLKEMGIPDHLTCLLRNLYTDQEATVSTGYGKTDWFQIGKGVHQGCILSLCLLILIVIIYQIFYRLLKVKMKLKVTQSCLSLCNTMDYTVHGILQSRILEWVAVPFSRRSSQRRDQTRSPALQADSLPAEPPGKPKNTGVGSLSLLQQIFPTQESNWGLAYHLFLLSPHP